MIINISTFYLASHLSIWTSQSLLSPPSSLATENLFSDYLIMVEGDCGALKFGVLTQRELRRRDPGVYYMVNS